jgi:glutamate-1-semialdehyde 2,1-aminomutase
MAAGAATLKALTPELHSRIEARTAALVSGLKEIAKRYDVPITADHAGSMWGFFFHPGPVANFQDAKQSDTGMYKRFFHAALDLGVYLAPSAFEAAFTSAAHGDREVAETLTRLDDAMRSARA